MAALRLTQTVLEILTASGGSAPAAPNASAVQVTQVVLEVLTALGASGFVQSHLGASVVWTVSGVSGVVNVVIAGNTPISGAWRVSDGTSHLYSWVFGGVTHASGFASTATTSSILRTYSVTGGALGLFQVSTTLSATVSGQASSITSAVGLHVGACVWPNLFDGKIVRESQAARRVWPL